MGYLVDDAGRTIAPGALMVLYLSDEMHMDLRLPEVFGLLGEKMTMRFLEIFGGRTIEVPPVKKVREAFKTVSAHMRFDELMRDNTEEYAAEQVGIELDMKPKQVVAAWTRVRTMLARLEDAVKDVAKKD